MRTKYNICSKLWTDINIDFKSCVIHSCCKTYKHQVSLDEVLEHGPNIFDKGNIIKDARSTMVEKDLLPKVCIDCIKSEPNSIRSVWNEWSDLDVERLKPDLLTDNIHTRFIELDIGNSCDLACIYCIPESSSTWAKELGLPNADYMNENTKWVNSVMSALMERISQLPSDNQMAFNIVGGEPTLLEETYSIIDKVAGIANQFDHPPVMMLTTNLNTKPALFKRLLYTIVDTKDKLNWQIAVSIEDIGERAEVIRHGLNWKKFEQNLKDLSMVGCKIYLVTTFNSISILNWIPFMNWCADTLGADNYLDKWAFTMNSVQSGYSEVAYMEPDAFDVEEYKAHYNRLFEHKVKDSTGSIRIAKYQEVLDHLDNMYGLLGTKERTYHYYKYWADLEDRRNINYKRFL